MAKESIQSVLLGNPWVGPMTLRHRHAFVPVFPFGNNAPATDANFGFPIYPSTCAQRRTGPMVLRNGRRAYFADTTTAPVTDTNFSVPTRVPNPNVGPMAQRWAWNTLPPYLNADLAPVTDTNFVLPVYPPGVARSVGPAVLRSGSRPYIPATDLAPVTDTNYILPTYPRGRTVGPPALRYRRAMPSTPSTAPFPTQLAGFRIEGLAALDLCVVAIADAPLGMGGVVRIKGTGGTYALYLVETTDPNASALRIKTATGVKAVRKKT